MDLVFAHLRRIDLARHRGQYATLVPAWELQSSSVCYLGTRTDEVRSRHVRDTVRVLKAAVEPAPRSNLHVFGRSHTMGIDDLVVPMDDVGAVRALT